MEEEEEEAEEEKFTRKMCQKQGRYRVWCLMMYMRWTMLARAHELRGGAGCHILPFRSMMVRLWIFSV
jgi:hypothetical protein